MLPPFDLSALMCLALFSSFAHFTAASYSSNEVKESSNSVAVMKIQHLLSTVREAMNSTDNSTHKMSEHNKLDKVKRKDLEFLKDDSKYSLMFAKVFDELHTLCKMLNPYEEITSWHQLANYVSVTTENQHDRFGCNAMLILLTKRISNYDMLIKQLSLLENKLLDWQHKLLQSSPFVTNSSLAPITFPLVTSRPSQSSPESSTQVQVASSKSPLLRWNKGLSRYDTSWIRPDPKNSDKEILFYDNFDPSKREEFKNSIGKSVIRIIPAVTVIVFLVLCWYFFVYRRMKQRQQRARQLLAQYQAILSGARTSGSSLMVVSESRARNDTAAPVFICSSSTYDSCLNDTCNTIDDSSCTEHCNASAPLQTELNNHTPRSLTATRTPRPANYPPTYEEIFPPSYESLYGTIV